MFKESKGLEYTLEVLRVLSRQSEVVDSEIVFNLVADGGRLIPSRSYLAKILPRMAKLGLVRSSDRGYKLARPLDEISVDMVLALCDTPAVNSPISSFCAKLREVTSTLQIVNFYDFSDSPPASP